MNFELIEAKDYCDALLRQVRRAKKRIVIAAMVILWGDRTAPLFAALQDAQKRGVHITILLDNYTRLTPLYDLRPRSSGRERLRQTFRALEQLSAGGAQVYTFGKIGIVPYKGRCHVKAAILDNTTYSFGGMNLFDEMFDTTDYMLSSRDPDLADCLTELVGRIGTTRPPMPDGEVPMGKDASVLFDGGRPGHSIIYERACELASQATQVHYVSQMVPSGQLAQALHETNTELYSNRPEQMMPVDSLGQAFDQQKNRQVNLYKGQQFIHAKYILFELPGGRKALLSGSHNFSYRGVGFGTQEIALYSTNTELWQTLYNHLKKRVAETVK